jgi:hypothetical protein
MNCDEIVLEQNSGAPWAENVCRLLLLLLLFCVFSELCYFYCFYFRSLYCTHVTLINNDTTTLCCLAWNITNSVPTYARNLQIRKEIDEEKCPLSLDEEDSNMYC